MDKIFLIVLWILSLVLMACICFWIQKHKGKPDYDLLEKQLSELKKDAAVSFNSMQMIQRDVRAMNDIMVNTKHRGNWGEYQLESLLAIYAGEHPEVFETQYYLNNGKIADCVLHIPNSNLLLCIDSKFPMENYARVLEDEAYTKNFKANMKKHIDDIANKYITTQTLDQAICFVPSEAIYQFICAKCSDTLDYALRNHVLITSPTTLVGVIYTLLASTRDFYRMEHISQIEKGILAMKEDVARLLDRSTKARKQLQTLESQLDLVSTSAQKIYRRMEKMEYKGEEYDTSD